MNDTTPTRSPDGIELIPASELTCEPVRWLWTGWLAQGKLHLLVGAPAAGKTTIAMALAAAISAGRMLPSGEMAQRKKVLVWSGEDDAKDTLVPRLRAMGGDDTQVLFVGDRTRGGRREPFDPARDLNLLRAEIERRDDIGLLILDPVVSAVSGDSHRNAEVRKDLQPIVDLAERTGIAVLGITHMAKGTAGRDPTERVIGSIAFAALARVVMIADVGNDGGLLILSKNNIAPAGGGFRYALESAEVQGVDTVRVRWGDRVTGSARELLGQQETDREIGSSAIKDACDWLDTHLQDGPKPSKEVRAASEDAGIAWRTVQRAKTLLRVAAKKNAGEWVWERAKDAKTANET